MNKLHFISETAVDAYQPTDNEQYYDIKLIGIRASVAGWKR